MTFPAHHHFQTDPRLLKVEEPGVTFLPCPLSDPKVTSYHVFTRLSDRGGELREGWACSQLHLWGVTPQASGLCAVTRPNTPNEKDVTSWIIPPTKVSVSICWPSGLGKDALEVRTRVYAQLQLSEVHTRVQSVQEA